MPAQAATEDTAPSRTIVGPNTGFTDPLGPFGVASTATGELLVTDVQAHSVSVFAAGATGDVAPVRTIKGAATGLFRPYGVALLADGKIAVSHATLVENQGQISVFAADADGDVAPVRTIVGENTRLVLPTGLAVLSDGSFAVVNGEVTDGEGNPTDPLGGKIVNIFAPDASGNTAPVRSIVGEDTGLDGATGIAALADGSLAVANANEPSVRVFAPAADGNVAPARVITGGSTQLVFPIGVSVLSDGLLWVSNGPGNSVLAFAADADGDVAPSRELAGANTTLNFPANVAGLPGGDLAVVNYFSSSVTVYSSGGDPGAKVPDAPTALTATPGDGELSIDFTPGADGGSPITDYEYQMGTATVAPDKTFNTAIGTQLDGQVNAVAVQPDGKILVGGLFTTPSRGLARFNADGTPDNAFNANVGSSLAGTVTSVAVLSGGKIVVGRVSVTPPSNLLTGLNADGTEDTEFNANVPKLSNGGAQALAVQTDGKIVVGGNFTTPSSNLARLNADGSADTEFNSKVPTKLGTGPIWTVAVQSDGKIVVGGQFFEPSRALARLNSDGSPDGPFNTIVGSGIAGIVRSVALQSDGKIVVGGLNLGLTRHNSDGSSDTTFNTNSASLKNSGIFSVAVQDDDKILAGGTFVPSPNLARFDKDGTPDTTFNDAVGTIFDSRVTAVALQADGGILAGGAFTTPASYLARFTEEVPWTSVGTAAPPVVLTGLTNGTTYNVKLRAVNAVGAGAASEAVEGTPEVPSNTDLFKETFTGAKLRNPSGVFLPESTGKNRACLTASSDITNPVLPGCADPSLDTPPDGVLRLTTTTSSSVGAVFGAGSVPTSQVLDVQFDSYQWGGGFAGDGIGFILAAVDPTVQSPPLKTGRSGGSLGYAPYVPFNAPGLANGYLGIGLDRFGNFSDAGTDGNGCTVPDWGGSRAQNQVVVRGPGKGLDGYCLINSSQNPDNGLTQPVLQGANRAGARVPVRVTINPTGAAVTLPDTAIEVPARSYRVQFTGIGQSPQAFTGPLPNASGFYDSSWLDANGVPKQLAFGWAASTGGAVNNHEVSMSIAESVFPVPTVSSEFAFKQTEGESAGTGAFEITTTVTGADLNGDVYVRGTVSPNFTLEAAEAPGWEECTVSGNEYSCIYKGPVTEGTELPKISLAVVPVGTVGKPEIANGLTVRSLSPDALGTCEGNCVISVASTPLAPSGLVATPGDGSASIAFTAGADGGSPITNYEYSTDGGKTWVALNPADTASPVTIPGLKNGTKYEVALRAVNTAGAGAASSVVAVTPRTTPDAPTSLVATPGDGEVSVAFTAGGDGGAPITNYEYTVDGGTTWVALDPKATSSPLTIPGLLNGTTYELALRAVNEAGGGAASDPVTITPGVPLAPTDLVAAPGNGSASVSFTPGETNGSAITNYQYSLDGGASWKPVVPPTAGSPVAIAGLTNGTEYSILLRGVNGNGSGLASEPVKVIPSTLPSAPTALSAKPSDGMLEIGFTPGSDGGSALTNYQYSVDGGPWTALDPADASSPVMIPGLTNGTSYVVALKAVNANGVSPASGTVTGTPSTVPDAPTSLTGARGDGQAVLSFTAPASDGGSPITNYEYTIDGGTTWKALDPAATTSPVTVPGLTNGTKYDISLRALNARGPSDPAGPVSVTPAGVPGVPENVVANAGPGSVALSFTAPANNGSPITGYEYSVDGGTTWVAFAPPVTGSPAIITGLPTGEAVEVSLRAVNGVGPGAGTDPSEVTPVGVPAAPELVRVVPGDGQVEVFVDAPTNTGGLPITNFEYTTDGGTTWKAFRPEQTGPSFSAMILGLENGTGYEVAVRAINDLGSGESSRALQVVVGAPTAPPGLLNPGDGSLKIEFFPDDVEDNGDPVTNFEYSLDGGDTWVALDPASTESPIVVEGLENGTEYEVLLRAVNGRGAGEAANYGTVIVGAPTAPVITTVVPGDGELTFEFTPAEGNGAPVSNYQYRLIAEGETEPGPWTDFDPAVTGSPVTVGGLTNGTGYVVELRAVNGRGAGPGGIAEGTPGTPTAPSALQPTPGNGEVTIEFTTGRDNGFPIINHRFLVVPEGGQPFLVTPDPAQTTSPVKVTNLANGVPYQIFVIPVNANGDGQVSQAVEVTPRTTPDAPTSLSAQPGYASAVVEFAAPDSDGGAPVTNYEYSTDGGATWTALDPESAFSPVTVPGLPNGVATAIQLRAVNAAGSGAASDPVVVTPLGAAFVPVEPYRAYDSRDGDGKLAAGEPRLVETGVPEGAVAVAYNLTAVGMTGGGFLAVAPGGSAAGGTSTLNYTAPGQQWANAFSSGVNSDGQVQVTVGGASTDFIVDVVGYYTPQTELNGVTPPAFVEGVAEQEAVPAGAESLFVPITPRRAYDSRDVGAGGTLGNGKPRRVNVTAGGIVPENATAVAYTLTQTGTAGRGVLVVAPAGGEMPAVSNINWFSDNQTSANSSVVGIANGAVDVWARSSTGGGAQFVIDILGYYLPADEAPWAASFTAIDPQRAYDSREDDPTGPISGGQGFTTSMAVKGVPEQAAAVAFNLTATGGTGTGFLTTVPGDVLAPPVASTLNWWQPNQTLANGSVVDVPTLARVVAAKGGEVNGTLGLPVTTFAGGGSTQYVIDVAGYYTYSVIN